MSGDAVLVQGGCHCKAVRWEAQVPRKATVIDCLCSICAMKANKHIVLNEAHFKLLRGSDELTCYRFNTRRAQHLFCKLCGTQSFYRPRSNPDGVGINPACIDAESREKLQLTETVFDGRNWETKIAGSGIQSMSKL
eukprot:TRINITY_DN28111_c0_g1_i1.p1 TRINITY_DN28111_c0_g1~~TRINITY_DN28111_c0_g1_i1.p1  ORF type:complete len:137 (+),score=42.05 TRINITY_DN28111_c0_g1_i1:126-536(+)